MLPCHHDESIVAQIDRAKELLYTLHLKYPEILKENGIDPEDYMGNMVFRSAVESIRGTYISSTTTAREAMVGSFLEAMKTRGLITDYTHTGKKERCDFSIRVSPDYPAAIEVKGGEGNSINISDRPDDAREFAIWSHLDGAIVNDPAVSAHKVINRIANEMTSYEKLVDMLFVRDTICGTPLRPCGKYEKASTCSLGLAPDIFLFPQTPPTADNRQPPMHTLDTLRLPRLMLTLFEIPPEQWLDHIWEVRVSMVELPPARGKKPQGQLSFGSFVEGLEEVPQEQKEAKLVRTVSIWHKGKQIDNIGSRR